MTSKLLTVQWEGEPCVAWGERVSVYEIINFEKLHFAQIDPSCTDIQYLLFYLPNIVILKICTFPII